LNLYPFPENAGALFNFSMLLEVMGRFEEAEALCRRALEIEEKLQGVGHEDTVQIITALARLSSVRRSMNPA